jgi:hypothetical protein
MAESAEFFYHHGGTERAEIFIIEGAEKAE